MRCAEVHETLSLEKKLYGFINTIGYTFKHKKWTVNRHLKERVIRKHYTM